MPKYVKTTLTVTLYTEVDNSQYYQVRFPDKVLDDFRQGAMNDPYEFCDNADYALYSTVSATAEYVTELPHQHEEESE
jgi:hypothetical protein